MEENVLKPSCVIEYNNGMGSIEKNNQQSACFLFMQKYMKGYKTYFFTCLALLSTIHIIYGYI